MSAGPNPLAGVPANWTLEIVSSSNKVEGNLKNNGSIKVLEDAALYNNGAITMKGKSTLDNSGSVSRS